MLSNSVQRALDSSTASIQYVGVNHRSANIPVTEEFLYSSYVVAITQQMRGKRMTKRV